MPSSALAGRSAGPDTARGDAHGKRPGIGPHGHAVGLHVDRDSARFQPGEQDSQVIGHQPHNMHRAARDGRGEHQRGGFDAIGNDAVAAPAEPLDPFDFHDRRAQTADPRAQRVQHAAQVDDFRFARRTTDDRSPAGEHGGAKDIRRARHRGAAGTAEVDCGAAELLGPWPRRSRDPAADPRPGRPVRGGADRRAGRRCRSRRAAAPPPCPAVPAAAQGRRNRPASAAPRHSGPAPRGHRPVQHQAVAVAGNVDAQLAKRRPMVRTSVERGTPSSSSGPSARIAAAIIGSAAFFAPLTDTVPCSGTPPVMMSSVISFLRLHTLGNGRDP